MKLEDTFSFAGNYEQHFLHTFSFNLHLFYYFLRPEMIAQERNYFFFLLGLL